MLTTGGHPLPVLIRPGGDPTLFGAEGPLLGVMEDPTFVERSRRLEAGDVLLLYTDGVTEGRRDRELYGEERLLAAVSRGTTPASIDRHLRARRRPGLSMRFGPQPQEIGPQTCGL